jgi:hypothetical protein
MQVTIISDCADSNAKGRQEIRYKSLMGGNANLNFIGVSHDLEASGCLVDALDAYQDNPGIIVVNVAPRGNKDKYPNGIPFCFAKVGNVTIVGTPNCFSLAKKLGLMSEIFETDVYDVCKQFLPEEEAKRISESQFRSYEYLPHLTNWIFQGKNVKANSGLIHDFGADDFVWYVDCFGNCKTTIVYQHNQDLRTSASDYDFVPRLADVPKDGKPYFIKGSSGHKNQRFIEIVVQNKSASSILNLKVGDRI